MRSPIGYDLFGDVGQNSERRDEFIMRCILPCRVGGFAGGYSRFIRLAGGSVGISSSIGFFHPTTFLCGDNSRQSADFLILQQKRVIGSFPLDKAVHRTIGVKDSLVSLSKVDVGIGASWCQGSATGREQAKGNRNEQQLQGDLCISHGEMFTKFG